VCFCLSALDERPFAPLLQVTKLANDGLVDPKKQSKAESNTEKCAVGLASLTACIRSVYLPTPPAAPFRRLAENQRAFRELDSTISVALKVGACTMGWLHTTVARASHSGLHIHGLSPRAPPYRLRDPLVLLLLLLLLRPPQALDGEIAAVLDSALRTYMQVCRAGR
jgi:hypothetical protein